MVTLQKTICPICEAEVSVASEFLEGELIKCLGCGGDLEATHNGPSGVSRACHW